MKNIAVIAAWEVRQKAEELKAYRRVESLAEVDLREALDRSVATGDAAAVAASLKISQPHLSDVRHGRRGISSELLEKLCEVGK